MWATPASSCSSWAASSARSPSGPRAASLDWWLLEQPRTTACTPWSRTSTGIYRGHRALWELDADRSGFEWLDADDAAHNTFSWLRFGTGDRSTDAPVVACVMNFSGETQQSYRIGLPRGGRWTVVLDTAGYHPDAPSSTGLVVEARAESWHDQPYAVDLTVPRLSTVWLVPVDEPEAPAVAATSDLATSGTLVNAAAEPAVTTTNGDPS